MIYMIVLFVMFLILVGMGIGAVVHLVRKRTVERRTILQRMVMGITLYTIVLCGVGLGSRPRILALGERKCFDEWCFTVNSIMPTRDGYTIAVGASNQGRRAQRPDSPRLIAVLDGRAVPVNCPQLGERIEGETSVPFSISLAVPASVRTVSLQVTEGGFPSCLTIDDDTSPFHARSSWLVRR